MGRLNRARAIVGLAISGLLQERLRTPVAVIGVVIAVLAVTLLVGGGIGVLQFGEEQFAEADRDLWVTGGPIGIATAGGGGLENSIQDAHVVAESIDETDGVRNAVPLLFQRVYISAEAESFDTILATGVTGAGGNIKTGEGFSRSEHYANGSYTGPMNHEIIIDSQTSDRYNVSIGDTLYVGGTLSAAADRMNSSSWEFRRHSVSFSELAQ
ncbi:MAG: ABC transporter permease [Natrialbaceae archaeon]|nr:ABC transporter permease [Natrialbaceae archaeon]